LKSNLRDYPLNSYSDSLVILTGSPEAAGPINSESQLTQTGICLHFAHINAPNQYGPRASTELFANCLPIIVGPAYSRNGRKPIVP